MVRHATLGGFVAALAMAICLHAAVADDETKATPANDLTARCLLLVRAESAFPPSSNRQSLEAHQLRMRTICWNWHALAVSTSAEGRVKAAALLERCIAEAPFDLARAHELYYERHVKSVAQMCRDFDGLVGGDTR